MNAWHRNEQLLISLNQYEGVAVIQIICCGQLNEAPRGSTSSQVRKSPNRMAQDQFNE